VKDMPKDPFDLPNLYPSQPKRDSRRAFNQTQKKEILYQQKIYIFNIELQIIA